MWSGGELVVGEKGPGPGCSMEGECFMGAGHGARSLRFRCMDVALLGCAGRLGCDSVQAEVL